MSFLAPLEQDGILLVSAAVARTDGDARDDEIQVNQGAGRSWIVLPRVIPMAGSGAVNAGYVWVFRGGFAIE